MRKKISNISYNEEVTGVTERSSLVASLSLCSLTIFQQVLKNPILGDESRLLFTRYER